MPSERTPAISVIVAAKNAAPYIEQCLASLCEGDPPLDVIVVDDGSTDDTAVIVERLAVGSRRRITLVGQTHSGLSTARNTGLAHAAGEYIGFVDADDWVQPGGYAALLEAAKTSQADVIIGNGAMVDHSSGRTSPFRDAHLLSRLASRGCADSPRARPDLFLLDTSVCRRLFRRRLFELGSFRFPERVLFEDVVAHFQLLLGAARVRVLDCDLYRYRINHPGRITDRRDESVLTIFHVLDLCQDVLTAHYADDTIWSCFIAFQSWVLRWLGDQIDASHLDAFITGVETVTARFPQDGVAAFRRRFADDPALQASVARQLNEGGAAFVREVRGGV